jgi:NAD(P)-dependent dehydrogenase (short-subunit alcohol dehydrogenase family)
MRSRLVQRLPVALILLAVTLGGVLLVAKRVRGTRRPHDVSARTHLVDAQAPAPRAGTATTGTVLVTGANRGLGLEFARQYAASGWQVIATARAPENAAELAALRDRNARVRVEQLDVTDAASVRALAERLKGQPIDLLINNAGVAGPTGKLPEIDLTEFERVMLVNTLGPVRVTQALLPNLRSGAGKKVVSITSGLGGITQNETGGSYAYRESKAALNMFMRSLALELKDEGFICIPINPGWVQTDMGGRRAPLTPADSIRDMRAVIDNLKPEDSGKFWHHNGRTGPW